MSSALYLRADAYAPNPRGKGRSGDSSKMRFFAKFWLILVYFRASGVSPIDPVRRELQNALGEMKLGDFWDL